MFWQLVNNGGLGIFGIKSSYKKGENMSQNHIQILEQAQFCLDSGDREQGIILLQQASELAEKTGEPVQQSAILNNLALEQDRVGQGEEARESLLLSLKILQSANTLNEAHVLKNLGLIERNELS
ncbi:MAG: tetratricopeptide repeat protein [Sphaerospermopsis sp. SIO1G2]|nr:tetratricopeptide repeat protein [Sphaerospermopsis sp. SIO1G2]